MGVLVIDAASKPVNYVSERKAVHMCLNGRAFVLLEYEDRIVRTQLLTIKVPRVIGLYRVVPLPKYHREHVSKKWVHARDGYTCVYCEREERELEDGNYLSVDHVKPRSKFTGTRTEQKKKANTWDNVVSSCFTCNCEKGDKLPHEAGMYPTKHGKPYSPQRPELVLMRVYENIPKLDSEQKQFIKKFA